MQSKPIKLAVLTPVYNDWDCLSQLIDGLEPMRQWVDCIELLVVNDGSNHVPATPIEQAPNWLKSITVLNLVSNVGHQRAIAIGLCHLVSTSTADAILTLDSDGEDTPESAMHLVDFWLHHRSAIAVGARGKRSEGHTFTWFYRTYKLVFWMFTGGRIDFGNFAVLPMTSARRLAAMPELWNHYPSTMLKSRLELRRRPINRGQRYAGRSRMSVLQLINHGLSSVSVFSDTVLARLLLATLILAGLLASLALLVLAIKLFTDLAIPGWASLIFGLTALGILQVLTTQVVVIFLSLSSRSRFQMPTIAMASAYVETVRCYPGQPS
jgi:glycosyltransferase involved in cell wall biosynthesis